MVREVKTFSQFEKHVQYVLLNYQHLSERRFSSADFGACDTLMDFQKALFRSDITDTQKNVLDLMYNKRLNQSEVAVELGISQKNVSSNNVSAIKKIASKYLI